MLGCGCPRRFYLPRSSSSILLSRASERASILACLISESGGGGGGGEGEARSMTLMPLPLRPHEEKSARPRSSSLLLYYYVCLSVCARPTRPCLGMFADRTNFFFTFPKCGRRGFTYLHSMYFQGLVALSTQSDEAGKVNKCACDYKKVPI